MEGVGMEGVEGVEAVEGVEGVEGVGGAAVEAVEGVEGEEDVGLATTSWVARYIRSLMPSSEQLHVTPIECTVLPSAALVR